MRRRSGGIHSNSQQEFFQLANLAHNSATYSLFYDYPNQKSPQITKCTLSPEPGNHLILNPMKTKNQKFSSFDFDHESYHFGKDCEELRKIQQKANSNKKKTHFAILTKNVQNCLLELHAALRVTKKSQLTLSGALNLYTHREGAAMNELQFIDCYWIIDVEHKQKYESLFNVYIEKSEKVLNLVDQVAHAQMCQGSIKKLVEWICQKRKRKQNLFQN